MAYRFGPFLYDPISHSLLREGTEVPLAHKSRELLLLFLHNPGRLLTREALIQHVWPDVAVTDDAIRFQVMELRKAFGADGESFIRTIRREGYRFEATVRAEEHRPAPKLAASENRPTLRYRLVLETREVQLLEGENVVGRDPDAALWIDHPSVSRRHARIVIAAGRASIEDLKSKNGTFVLGRRIENQVALSDGDEVRVGPETFVFRTLSASTTHTERRS